MTVTILGFGTINILNDGQGRCYCLSLVLPSTLVLVSTCATVQAMVDDGTSSSSIIEVFLLNERWLSWRQMVSLMPVTFGASIAPPDDVQGWLVLTLSVKFTSRGNFDFNLQFVPLLATMTLLLILPLVAEMLLLVFVGEATSRLVKGEDEIVNCAFSLNGSGGKLSKSLHERERGRGGDKVTCEVVGHEICSAKRLRSTGSSTR